MKQKASIILQLVVLTAAFVGVVYAIKRINTDGISPKMSNALGLKQQTASKGAPEAHSIQRLTWCETRVKALSKPQGSEIFQQEYKWYLKANPPKELDFIAVEKWFGKNCSLVIQPLTMAEADLKGPLMTSLVVEFIKGASVTLKRTAEGVFQWQGAFFRSPEMDQALLELDQIPESTSPK